MIHSWHQTSEAVLELAVLGGVDERVDAAAGEHQDHGEVIEPRDDREFYETAIIQIRKSCVKLNKMSTK